jgi:hypothetical protein
MTTEPGTGEDKSAGTPKATPRRSSDDQAAEKHVTPLDAASFLEKKLEDAVLLLNYAAESGTPVDDSVSRSIVAARSAPPAGWTEDMAAKLLQAVATLAKSVSPVTAVSLRICAKSDVARKMIRGYRPTAIVVALIVIGFSAIAFLTSNLSQSINQSLDTANTLAVKLRDELGPGSAPDPELCKSADEPAIGSPQATHNDRGSGVGTVQGTTADSESLRLTLNQKDVIADLQKFAMSVRQMHGDANSLNRVLRFVLPFWTPPDDPFKGLSDAAVARAMELPPSLRDLPNAARHNGLTQGGPTP